MPPENKAFIYNVQKFSDRYELGIHPSYRSKGKPDIMENELQLLQAMITPKIKMSRQHYLLLNFPETYRNLLSIGIREDYTMGYPDISGFRAGTSRPFFWYDLEKESSTELRIFPFQLMDVTLNKYLGLSPDEAVSEAKSMVRKIKDVGGYCSLIWHNSSFYAEEGWANWEDVYIRILNEAKEN